MKKNIKLSNESVNPFFTSSSLYMNYPAFDKISNKHYGPAFERGMADHLLEIEKFRVYYRFIITPNQ